MSGLFYPKKSLSIFHSFLHSNSLFLKTQTCTAPRYLCWWGYRCFVLNPIRSISDTETVPRDDEHPFLQPVVFVTNRWVLLLLDLPHKGVHLQHGLLSMPSTRRNQSLWFAKGEKTGPIFSFLLSFCNEICEHVRHSAQKLKFLFDSLKNKDKILTFNCSNHCHETLFDLNALD